MGRSNPGPKGAPATIGPPSVGTDLFGDPVTTGPATSKPGESNDMDLVRSVIATAIRDGYAVTGVGRKVNRIVADGEIEPVPAYEAAMVEQLIERGWLKEGGQRKYHHRGREGHGRSVLVPKPTRETASRWGALTPLPTQRAGHIRDASTGRAATGTSTRSTKTSTSTGTRSGR